MRSQLLHSANAPRPDLRPGERLRPLTPAQQAALIPALWLQPGSQDLPSLGSCSSTAPAPRQVAQEGCREDGEFRVGSSGWTPCGSHDMGLPLSSSSSSNTNPSHLHPSALSRSQRWSEGLAHSQGLGLKGRGCRQDVGDKTTVPCGPGGLEGTPNPPKKAVDGQKGSGPGSSQPW